MRDGGTEKFMAKVDQTKPIIISTLVISLVFAIINISGHIKQVIQLFTAYIQVGQFQYINLSNMLYCILGFILLFIPINILVKPKTMETKTKMIKYTYYFVGIAYLLGNLWVVKWIFNMFLGTASADISQFQYDNGLMFTHLSWGMRNEVSALMNIYVGALYIYLGSIIDVKYKSVYKLVLIIAFSTFILPIVLYSMFNPVSKMYWWIKKSFPEFLSNLAMAGVYAYACRDAGIWDENICLLSESGAKKGVSKKTAKSEKASENKSDSEKHHHHHHHHHHHRKSDENTPTNVLNTESEYINIMKPERDWKPVDIVHGNDKVNIKYDHKINEAPESREGVKISDIVMLEKNKNQSKPAEKPQINDNSDEGEIIWISKNK